MISIVAKCKTRNVVSKTLTAQLVTVVLDAIGYVHAYSRTFGTAPTAANLVCDYDEMFEYITAYFDDMIEDGSITHYDVAPPVATSTTALPATFTVQFKQLHSLVYTKIDVELCTDVPTQPHTYLS